MRVEKEAVEKAMKHLDTTAALRKCKRVITALRNNEQELCERILRLRKEKNRARRESTRMRASNPKTPRNQMVRSSSSLLPDGSDGESRGRVVDADLMKSMIQRARTMADGMPDGSGGEEGDVLNGLMDLIADMEDEVDQECEMVRVETFSDLDYEDDATTPEMEWTVDRVCSDLHIEGVPGEDLYVDKAVKALSMSELERQRRRTLSELDSPQGLKLTTRTLTGTAAALGADMMEDYDSAGGDVPRDRVALSPKSVYFEDEVQPKREGGWFRGGGK